METLRCMTKQSLASRIVDTENTSSQFSEQELARLFTYEVELVDGHVCHSCRSPLTKDQSAIPPTALMPFSASS